MPRPTSTGIVITDESRAAYKEWIDQNPLRAWRLSHTPKLSILEAAERVGVGMSMMQMYERGVHKPGPAKHATFAALLGKDWETRWDAWLDTRPAA